MNTKGKSKVRISVIRIISLLKLISEQVSSRRESLADKMVDDISSREVKMQE